MWRESFSYISGTGNPGKIRYNSRKEIFYISGNENPKKNPIFYKVTFPAQYKKLLKSLLYFGKWNFLAANLKTFCFLEEPLRDFHHCFSGLFYFLSLIFTTVFWVFSLLIEFLNVTIFDAFFSGTSYLCCYTAIATDLTGIFRFLPYTPFPNLPQYRVCYDVETAFFTLRHFLPYTPFQQSDSQQSGTI